MAFYSPVQGTLGWHERRNGEFGPWVASRAVPPLKSKHVRLTALVEGDRIRSLLTDDEGNAYVCAGKVDRLKQAGRVGVYFDTAAKVGQQTVDDFVVIGRGTVIQDDAVQVVVPASVRGDRFVWDVGEHVAVTGSDDRSPLRRGEVEGNRSEDECGPRRQASAGVKVVSHPRTREGLGAVSRPWIHATGYRA